MRDNVVRTTKLRWPEPAGKGPAEASFPQFLFRDGKLYSLTWWHPTLFWAATYDLVYTESHDQDKYLDAISAAVEHRSTLLYRDVRVGNLLLERNLLTGSAETE